MSSSSKRKVTLEKTSSDSGDKSKPSVFDRLGPGLSEDNRDICREFLKRGSCTYGKSCKFPHPTKSDKNSEDHHKSSRSKHEDIKSDSEKTGGSKSRRDSKDGKIKSAVGVVSKHSVEGGDNSWADTGSRNDEHKYESKSGQNSRQKDSRGDSPSKNSARTKDSKPEEDSSSKSKKKKKRTDSSVSPDRDAFHKRHHGRYTGDAEMQRESSKQQKSPGQAESPRSSEKTQKSKDSIPARLQKLAMESDVKVADKKSRKSSPGRNHSDQVASSGIKRNDVASPTKSRDAKGSKSLKGKEDGSPTKDKDYKNNKSPPKDRRKDRDASPSHVKPKEDTKSSRASKDPTVKGQKHGTKRTRKDSSSSSSSGTSSSSDSSSGSSSSGSSSSSSSSSSAASTPRRRRKAVKRERNITGSDRKKDDHSKRHHNTEKVTEGDDRQKRGGYEMKAESNSRSKDVSSQKLTETMRVDEANRRRKDQLSPLVDSSSRRRDNVRDDDRWHADSFGDSSKKIDREKSMRDNVDERRRTGDMSPRSQKLLRDDRETDRRKRESPSDRYASKTSSGRYDKDEQHEMAHDLPAYEQRQSDMVVPSEHIDDRDARHTPRSDRDHYADRFHNAGDAGEDARRDRQSRRGQWENDREAGGEYTGRRAAASRPEARGHSDKYDASRDRSRQVRESMRDDERRNSRPDLERSRDERVERERDRAGEHERVRTELDRSRRDRERGNDRDREQVDRSRDRDHAVEQEWDYNRHRELRDRSKDVKPESSDIIKSGSRSDRHGDNYYRDTKRRRSLSTHEVEDGWDRHRADKKRSRYDEEDKSRDRGQHRDDGRYSVSRDHSPGYISSKQDRLDVVDRDRRGDGLSSKLSIETGRSKADDKRDILPKEAELSALPTYITEERSHRSPSRGSLGSRTSQRDHRIDPRMDPRSDYRFEAHHEFRSGEFRDPLDSRGGFREVDRLRDRPVGSLPLYEREPFPDREIGYFRGESRGGVGIPGPGYDRPGRIEVDVTRPPPPLPFRGHNYEQDRMVARDSVEARDYDWHASRGYRGPSRPPNWERPEGQPRDEWESRYGGISRAPEIPSDHRPGQAPPPSVPREEFRVRESGSLPPPLSTATLRADSARSKPDDQAVPAVVEEPVTETPTAVVEAEVDSKANLTDDIGYDDISDDELDDLITGAEDAGDEKQPDKIAVVDILDIKWDSLMQQDRQKLTSQRSSALKRFKAHSIFSQIGVSVAFAGEALVQKLKSVCLQQMTEEAAEEAVVDESNSVGNDEELGAKAGDETVKAEPLAIKIEQMEQAEEPQETTVSLVKAEDAVKKVNVAPLPIKFELISPLAEFHSSMVKKSKERLELVANLGSYRRALCARRDLAIRRALCKVDKEEVGIYPPQEVDHDLYKLSLQLFYQDRDRKLSSSSLSGSAAGHGLCVAPARG